MNLKRKYLMILLTSSFLLFGLVSNVDAVGGCNDVALPEQLYCLETNAEDDIVEVVAGAPSNNLQMEVVFGNLTNVRVGCQNPTGILWLESTNNTSGVSAEWHSLAPNGESFWVSLQFVNMGVGTLANCELWGQSAGFTQVPLEGVLESSNGSLIRFALMIEDYLSDGDTDSNRVVETPTSTTTTTIGGGGPAVDCADVPEEYLFFDEIAWMVVERLTTQCDSSPFLYKPLGTVTRGQMAAFLHRALPDLPKIREAVDFTDDDDSVFEGDIEWLYSRGVTQGTSPTTYSPDKAVTRGQMAAFLVRALKLTDNGGGDLFTDDDSSIFEEDIDRLATAGVTIGCNPPSNTKFCPDSSVTRGQMAAFLYRALRD